MLTQLWIFEVVFAFMLCYVAMYALKSIKLHEISFLKLQWHSCLYKSSLICTWRHYSRQVCTSELEWKLYDEMCKRCNDVYQWISWNMFSFRPWLVESRKFDSSGPMGESHIPSCGDIQTKSSRLTLAQLSWLMIKKLSLYLHKCVW